MRENIVHRNKCTSDYHIVQGVYYTHTQKIDCDKHLDWKQIAWLFTILILHNFHTASHPFFSFFLNIITIRQSCKKFDWFTVIAVASTSEWGKFVFGTEKNPE